jgi:glycosyltransferase EpsF
MIIKEPIRVAHIIGKMAAGGVESVVLNYYRHIDRNKIQFDFVIDEDSTVVPEEEITDMGGKIYKIPPYQQPIKYHKALKNLIQKNRYKIVHSHINTLSVFSLFAAKRAGAPVRIAHSHSTAGRGELVRNIMKYSLRPFSKVFATHYCACGEYAGRWMFGNRCFDMGKVFVVRNAIDVSKFKFSPEIRNEVRNELNINDKFVIGHVGRFMKQKNHSFLIDIFDEVHKQKPNAVLMLVGEGELEKEIRNKVNILGLNDAVLFLGVRNDVNRLLQAMDVFLLPSLYEGFPIVGLEAQAAGLKIFTSDKVTVEINISDNIKFLSLRLAAKEWAEIMLNSANNRFDNDIKLIKAKGYEIGVASSYLANYYKDF